MRILLVVPYGRERWPKAKSGGAQRSVLLWKALRRLGEVRIVAAMPRTIASGLNTQVADDEFVREDGLQEIVYDSAREAGPFRFLRYFLWGNLRQRAKNLAICSGDFSIPDHEAFKKLEGIVRDFQPDIVVCRWLRWAVATGGSFVSDIPVLLDLDVLDWRVYASQEEQKSGSGIAKRLHSGIYARIIKRNASKLLKRFSHVWVVSEDDRLCLDALSCTVLPNVPVIPTLCSASRADNCSSGGNILFVGNLGFAPNLEGLEHFLFHVWPRVHEAEPELRLRIVGSLPDSIRTTAVRWRQVPNVEVVGFVDELGAEYQAALFTIAPIYWGGGTKIKVLESLGWGKACVLTPHAIYGLRPHVEHGLNVLCANDDFEFVEACLKLVRSEDLRRSLAAKAEQVVREHFSVSQFNKEVAATVVKCVEKVRPLCKMSAHAHTPDESFGRQTNGGIS